MAEIKTIQSDTLSSQFFDDINTNFSNLNKETVYTDITADQIEDNAITKDKIENGAITETKIKHGSVKEKHLEKDSVTTDKIVDGTIQEEDLCQDLQVKLGNTKRIFIVDSIPIGSTITDIIKNVSIDVENGDIVVLVKGING